MVVSIHDVIPLDFPESLSATGRRLYPVILRRACGRAAYVIVPSTATRDELLQRGLATEGQIVVTPYATPHLPPESSQSLAIAEPYVLFVGSLRAHKNVVILLQAFAQLKSDRSAHLIVVGDGPDRKDLQRLAVELRIDPRVQFLGRVADSSMASLYRRASAVVAPSLAEGFGFTVLEAMAHGTPVIISATRALQETAHGAALEFDPTRAEELTLLLGQVCEDEGLRQKLRSRGLRRVDDLSWERTAAATEEAYTAALS